MSDFSLSSDQAQALERLLGWIKNPIGPAITLGGYAGTGKTTVAAALRAVLARNNSERKIAFCAFTGKASQVLRNTLERHEALQDGDTCGTIHSLLYSPMVDKQGRITGWTRSKEVEADLIVVDEASMVNQRIWLDLLGAGRPVIAIGDHGQLPPIEGVFNLMEKPDVTLERVHRQAEGNPIIQLAHEVRFTGAIGAGSYGKGVRKYSWNTDDPTEIQNVVEEVMDEAPDDRLLLCGRNKTRIELNRSIRRKLGRESDEPEFGDRVVCLKNEYQQSQPIYNGMTGLVDASETDGAHWYQLGIDFPDDGRRFDGRVSRYGFFSEKGIGPVDGLSPKEIGSQFDFGYALTVHKAQGSQARRVVLFEERFQKMDDEQWKRWLYTAITRAREELLVIGQ
jgi:exodeoxyribonuclease-5